LYNSYNLLVDSNKIGSSFLLYNDSTIQSGLPAKKSNRES